MFDFEEQMLLREAFERAGRARFGDAWRGHEVGSEEPFDPSSIISERARIEQELSRIRARLAAFDCELAEATAGERNEIAAACRTMYNKRDELRRSYHQIPKAGEVDERSKAQFDRRAKVETLLWQAFRKGHLVLLSDGAARVDVTEYEVRAGFSISFEFSLVRMSPHRSRRRHSIASVNRHAFTAWLRKTLDVFGNMETSAEAECFDWLQELAAGEKQATKDEYRKIAKSRFDGLSDRAFDRAWSKAVPKSWSRSGPLGPQ